MHVAIYSRVSTDVQAEHGYSIQTQIEACRQKAAELGADTVQEYTDNGYSGAYLDRPAMDALRDALRAKMYDAVVCYDPDRLSRNLAHQLLITEEIEKAGAALVFCTMDFSTNPEGRMFYQMRGVFAAYEREKIKERTMRGKRAALKAGKIILDSHVYGYDYDKEGQCYRVNPGEADVVREIFRLYLSGESIRSITSHLREKNAPTKTGRQWSTRTVHDILSRDMYGGKYYAATYLHTRDAGKKEVRIPRPETEWIPLEAPPIVKPELIAAAKATLAARRVNRIQRTRSRAMLQGIAYCAACGCRMYVVSGDKTETGRVKYYVCQRRDGVHTERGCLSPMHRVDIIDALSWEALERICRSERSLAKYIKQTAPAKKKENPEEKLKAIAAKRAAIMDWFSSGMIPQAETARKLKDLNRQEQELKKRQENSPAVDIPAAVELVRTCPADYQARRAIIHRLIHKVSFSRPGKLHEKQSEYDVTFIFSFNKSRL